VPEANRALSEPGNARCEIPYQDSESSAPGREIALQEIGGLAPALRGLVSVGPDFGLDAGEGAVREGLRQLPELCGDPLGALTEIRHTGASAALVGSAAGGGCPRAKAGASRDIRMRATVTGIQVFRVSRPLPRGPRQRLW
jgi:hypothetical protein